jgi:hypothetical protein
MKFLSFDRKQLQPLVLPVPTIYRDEQIGENRRIKFRALPQNRLELLMLPQHSVISSMHPMFNLDSLLTIYLTLQQENEDEIHRQIRQLQQQVMAQLEAIQAQERTFHTSQHEVLDQIRSHLATDARSLVFTDAFQAFIETLPTSSENKLAAKPIAPLFDQNPTAWRLHSLNASLKLDPIELLCEEGVDEDEVYTLYFIRIGMQIGSWQQIINVTTATLTDDSAISYSPLLHKQWAEVVEQLKTDPPPLPRGFGDSRKNRSTKRKATPDQQALIQELACLVLFVASLFNVHAVTDRLSNTCQWLAAE